MPNQSSPTRGRLAAAAAMLAILGACGGGGGGGAIVDPPDGTPPAFEGVVFADVNGDKVRDAGDVLLQDVEVTAWNGIVFLGAVLTTADGAFRFDETTLLPAPTPGATYELRVMLGQAALFNAGDQVFGMGWSVEPLVPANAGVDDTVDSDAVAADRDGQINAVISVTAPAAGQTDATIGFGFQGVPPPPPPKPTLK